MKPNWIAVGALLGALGVVAGAFGAHALKSRLDPAALEVWHTAVLYHLIHAPVLVLYGLFDREKQGRLAGWFLLGGLVLFSGSLYALALGSPRFLGAITPFGGALLILGWTAFYFHALRSARRQ